jgi:hypothetical protein
MIKSAIRFRTNGKVERVSVGGLVDMQSIVGGRIELVLSGGHGITRNGVEQTWDLYGNDEGRLLGLPLNPVVRHFIAEVLAGIYDPDGDEEPRVGNVLPMHGDFLLIGCNNEGESADCPIHIQQMAERMGKTHGYVEPFVDFIEMEEQA